MEQPEDLKLLAGIAARRAAITILFECLYKGQAFDGVFNSHARDLEERDRAFCRQLCLLTLRRKAGLDFLLQSMMKKPLDEKAQYVWLILEMGLAQILFLDTKAHAAVGLSVELVKQLKGPQAKLSGFVNALLRRSVREKDKLTTSLAGNPGIDLPKPVYTRWIKDWGPTLTDDLAQCLSEIPPTDISVRDEKQIKNWAFKLKGAKTPTNSIRIKSQEIETLPGFKSGQWWVQDAAAALPVRFLKPKAGEHILDLCAAPGGKTMQIAALDAQVTAVDLSKKRLKRVKENLERTKLSAELVCSDALKYTPSQPVDAVLLDAPCSATGTFRRNPDCLWTKKDTDINALAKLQEKLLDHTISMLKPGGRLVYCVCSLEKQEGEDQWAAFLKRHPDIEPVAITADEIGSLAGFITDSGTVRTYPVPESKTKKDTLSMDGFFIARGLKKP